MTPAEILLAAAELVRKRGREATPGPWDRPLDVRYKAVVTAPLPEGERGRWIEGVDPFTGRRERVGVVMLNMWSDGSFTRKRGGRDLEWVAMANPQLAPYLAGLFQREGKRVEAAAEDPANQEIIADPDVLGMARTVLKENTT